MATLLYGALYLLACAPGLPIGWRLFGRRQPLGWIAGALIGSALSALVFWVPAWLGLAHPLAFGAAWALLAAGTWWWGGARRDPLVALPAWTRTDARWWLALLVVVAVFVIVPFSRVGEPDETGARRYRAYFTADFVWHMAMTQELARFELPPVNPYLAPEPIHYYWTYFMVPAVLSGPAPAPIVPIETALKVSAIATALLMFSVIFLGTWAVTGRGGAAFAACLLALMAPSWEGLYTIGRYWSNGASIAQIAHELRGLNIDAITNWRFQGLRIDGLVRSMWWTPQHATSFTFGLLALIAVAAGAIASRGVLLAAGLLLALSVVMNPLLGAAFCAIHGLVVVWSIARGRLQPRALVDQALTVGPVAIALGWTVLNRMGGGAGDAVTIGWGGLGANAPILTLVLSLGGLLVPAAVALWPDRRVPMGRAWVAVPAFVVALALAWFVRITDIAWVGFRAGNIFQVTLPMLAAVGIARMADRSRAAAVAFVTVLVVAGAPTTLVDTFNAQDVDNRDMGPGFRWTIPISLDQQAGLRWIRSATPVDAVVQADPIVRGRDQWSLIPSFAGRRSAAGQPISLLATPEYLERSNAVHALLGEADVAAAHREAIRLGIDYVWLDETDEASIARRWRDRPDLFGTPFRRGAVHVFEVRPLPSSGLP